MKEATKWQAVSNAVLVLGVCGALLFPLVISGKASASEENEQVDASVEAGLEGEISTRGLQGKRQKPSMRKAQASSKSSSAGTSQQLAKLQQQVNALQAQVNALRAVIQVANGTTTLQSKHIRIQGETVMVKSLKGGVTFESKKDFKLESKRRMTVKASTRVDLEAGVNLNVKAGAQVDLEAGAKLNVKGGGLTSIRGAIIKLNNGGKPIARLGSTTMTSPVGGPGAVTSGSPTVLVP